MEIGEGEGRGWVDGRGERERERGAREGVERSLRGRARRASCPKHYSQLSYDQPAFVTDAGRPFLLFPEK